jgi:hypothetical protein
VNLTSKKICERLKEVWPTLNSIWLTDKKYLAVKQREMQLVLKIWEDELKNYEYLPTVSECEEFALFCHAFVKLRQLADRNDDYNWAYGECIAKKLLGVDMIHSANIYLTHDKIYLVEPQTGAFWEANPDEDTVFFVKM